ncbi:MAG: zf-HC2 domain-containing protein [Anaerolineae bacterium]|nr:zf-HC2 domain-containing protein [Anaerolineae bacterium]
MSEHINEWLPAYYDGELSGLKLRQAEAHLKECEACREKLNELQAISSILQESPAASGLTPADKFTAQVVLRLPRSQMQPGWQHTLQRGWQALPLGLFAGWAFIKSALIVTMGLAAVQRLGFGKSLDAAFQQISKADQIQAGGYRFTAAAFNRMGQYLVGSFNPGSLFGLDIFLKFVLPAAIGLAYLIWLMSWWRAQEVNDYKNGTV